MEGGGKPVDSGGGAPLRPEGAPGHGPAGGTGAPSQQAGKTTRGRPVRQLPSEEALPAGQEGVETGGEGHSKAGQGGNVRGNPPPLAERNVVAGPPNTERAAVADAVGQQHLLGGGEVGEEMEDVLGGLDGLFGDVLTEQEGGEEGELGGVAAGPVGGGEAAVEFGSGERNVGEVSGVQRAVRAREGVSDFRIADLINGLIEGSVNTDEFRAYRRDAGGDFQEASMQSMEEEGIGEDGVVLYKPRGQERGHAIFGSGWANHSDAEKQQALAQCRPVASDKSQDASNYTTVQASKEDWSRLSVAVVDFARKEVAKTRSEEGAEGLGAGVLAKGESVEDLRERGPGSADRAKGEVREVDRQQRLEEIEEEEVKKAGEKRARLREVEEDLDEAAAKRRRQAAKRDVQRHEGRVQEGG